MERHRQNNQPPSVKELLDYNVTNPQGEDLGKIEDVAITPGQGRADFVVISFGGFMGMGEKHFPILWQKVRLDMDNRNLVLNVDKDTLKDAPGFDKDEWPYWTGDEDYTTTVYRYYQVSPYWEESRARR
jgi:sporulation protein YlmC with PRC-barrel domain